MKQDIDVDDEWNTFLMNCDETDNESNYNTEENVIRSEFVATDTNIPKPSDLYISTKSKIAYLEQPIDLETFWNIPIIPYSNPVNGIIKKQIKLNSKTHEELQNIQNKIENEPYSEQLILTHIDNPEGRIKFKDIRKITIGLSNKDIMTYRSKKKQAFYNCFVVILRIKFDEKFREFHVKIFNTGKLEIPGVQSDMMFESVLKSVVDILQPFHKTKITPLEKSDTVLINSNFNCGFYINRENLFERLKDKYNIQAIYDPCSYPGIQCKFYYNPDIKVQSGSQICSENKDKYNNVTGVSFMIFRTGSVLIVGMCEEPILQEIYKFLKQILKNEFQYICQKIITEEEKTNKTIKKNRRKTIQILVNNIN